MDDGDHLDGWYQNERSWWSWSVWVEWCLAGGFGTTKTGRSSARRAHRLFLGQKYTFLDNLRLHFWLQVPQMFYPVEREMTLSAGDVVAARCTMVNNRDRWWHIYHILYHKYFSVSNVISLCFEHQGRGDYLSFLGVIGSVEKFPLVEFQLYFLIFKPEFTWILGHFRTF